MCVYVVLFPRRVVIRPSLMLVGNNKVVEDEVRWRRSKGVVMNSF